MHGVMCLSLARSLHAFAIVKKFPGCEKALRRTLYQKNI